MPVPSRRKRPARKQKSRRRPVRRSAARPARRRQATRRQAARKGSKQPRQAARRPKAQRSTLRASIGPWAVLNASGEDFKAVSMVSGHLLLMPLSQQLRARLAELGHKLVIRRQDTGHLMIARALDASRRGLSVTQGWRVDPAYQLEDKEHKAKGLTVVEAPNLPPKSIYIVNRLQ